MFTCRRSLVLLLFLHTAVAQSSLTTKNVQDLLASLRRRILPPAVEPGLSDTAWSLNSRDIVQRRALKQEEHDGACVWINDRDLCGLSGETAKAYLKTADNSIADHVYKTLECRQVTDKDYCEALDCRWDNSYCTLSFKTEQEFRSVTCLDKVRHIVERTTVAAECRSKSSEDDCAADDRCYWYDDQCSFDKWYFFFDVKTQGMFPEGTPEGIEARTSEIDAAIESARETGVIEEWNDLLDWDPPPFDCPSLKQAVCNYVEALTPIITYGRYCLYKYPSANNASECETDAYCVLNPADAQQSCGQNSEALVPAFRQSEMAFAKSIENPDARTFEMNRTDCQHTYVQKDCEKKDACLWSDSVKQCDLSSSWIEKEKYRLLRKEKDPVCQYFVLNVEYGCVDLEDKEDCAEQARCFYDDVSETCSVAYRGQVEYALATSDILDDFLKKSEECTQAADEHACLEVSLEATNDEIVVPEGYGSAVAPASVEEDLFTVDFLDDVDDYDIDDVKWQDSHEIGSRPSPEFTRVRAPTDTSVQNSAD